MTQQEKIEMLKGTIVYLYEKEGRSKSYISDVLEIDRKTLVQKINEWELVKADEKHLTPSTQKFLNKNKKIILDMLDSDATMSDVARKLKKSRSSILRTFIRNDKELLHHYNMYVQRREYRVRARIEQAKSDSSYVYDFEDLNNETWKEILGYDGYFVSNMGRVKHKSKRYDAFHLLTVVRNVLTQRGYVSIVNSAGVAKNLNVARLVAHAFVDGWTPQNNTVDHIDGDVTNDCASNLAWVSQGENNQRAYNRGKATHTAYSKNGKFQHLVIDGIYEFKTIRAASKFLQVSESQLQRYITGESRSSHSFEFAR